MSKLKKSFTFSIFLILILSLASALYSENKINNNSINIKNTLTQSQDEEVPKKEPKSCNITFAGDLVMHMPVVNSVYDKTTGAYNFDSCFSKVKDFISSSDYSVCNSETSYLGEGSEYSGYPCFNTPSSLLTSLKNVGFDGLTSAHNHSLDKGSDGINLTTKTIKENGFDLYGLKEDYSDKNYIVKDINGIKVGITEYTYASTDDLGQETLNGIPIPSDVEDKINYFDFAKIDKATSDMKNTLDNMKKDGAEFTIFYIHWGNEYQNLPSSEQETLAYSLNSFGIDVIIGSHPHVVEPIRKITDATSGKETLVCYSLGNFLSNQSEETIGKARSEDGLMVKLEIYKDTDDNVSLKSYDAEPTWVYRHTDDNGKIQYSILPVEEIIKTGEDTNYSAPVFNKIHDSCNATESTINS